ncbi:hypothetical protein NUSPORA_02963 [Nucleospora cyclopteri]
MFYPHISDFIQERYSYFMNQFLPGTMIGQYIVLIKHLFNFLTSQTHLRISAWAITILLGFFALRKFQRKKMKVKRVFFVGPRGTGKTSAICDILLNNVPSEQMEPVMRMVPTLEQHTAKINNLEIVECTATDDKNDLKKFHINGRDKFIFFVKNEDEVFPALDGFDVHFVIWKKMKEHHRKDLTYLDESGVKLIDLLYEN